MGENVYREALVGLLVKHILLCFVAVGFVTLPVALIRWNMRKMIVTDRAVTLRKGADSNVIPIARIDNIAVNGNPLGISGELMISAGGGVPTTFRVRQFKKARDDIQARIEAFHRQPQSMYQPQPTYQQPTYQQPTQQPQPMFQQPQRSYQQQGEPPNYPQQQ